MAKFYKISRGDITFLLLLLFLIGFIAGTTFIPSATVQQEKKQPAFVEGEKVVMMGLPAVDSEGKGVVGMLETRIRPGSGQVLVNVNDVLAQFDTQFSGRVAAKAAANFTKTDLGGIDIIYDMKVNASVVEGPSAGASMATSIVLALQNIPASQEIMITGTINEDGTVGEVGAILEKATAAKEEGATIFLVPEGQSEQLTSTRTKTCRMLDGVEVCQIKYVYGQVNIGETLNMTVLEVKNLKDIIDVYLNQSGKPDATV